MTAPLWVNLHFSCIREQFPEEEGKKGGGGIKLLAVPCFSYYYLQPLLPKLTGKKQLYFGRMSISLQGGRGTFSCVCFIWWDSPEETNLLTTVKVLQANTFW